MKKENLTTFKNWMKQMMDYRYLSDIPMDIFNVFEEKKEKEWKKELKKK